MRMNPWADRIRYVAMILSHKEVEDWPLALWWMAREIRRQMEYNRIEEWPTLKHSEELHEGWKLVFAWRRGA